MARSNKHESQHGDRNREKGPADPSRREVLKVAGLGLLAGLASPYLSGPRPADAAETGMGSSGVLTVFFSKTGCTRTLAGHIHVIMGGDIVELETVRPYPEDYEAVKEQAKQELNSGFKPALKTKIADIGAYKTIIVGSPVWWGTVAPPVMTFLTEYDLSGKTIVPFDTNLGSGLGRCVTDIARLCPNSTVVREGLAVWGRNAEGARREVAAWLKKIGLTA